MSHRLFLKEIEKRLYKREEYSDLTITNQGIPVLGKLGEIQIEYIKSLIRNWMKSALHEREQ